MILQDRLNYTKNMIRRRDAKLNPIKKVRKKIKKDDKKNIKPKI